MKWDPQVLHPTSPTPAPPDAASRIAHLTKASAAYTLLSALFAIIAGASLIVAAATAAMAFRSRRQTRPLIQRNTARTPSVAAVAHASW